MNIQLAWDEQIEDVVQYQFITHWTWDELQAAFRQELRMVQELGEVRYDVVLDMRHIRMLPPGAAITHLSGMFHGYPTHWGCTVVVTTSAIIVTMLRLFNRIYPAAAYRLFVVSTLDQARWQILSNRGIRDDQTRPSRPDIPIRPKNGD